MSQFSDPELEAIIEGAPTVSKSVQRNAISSAINDRLYGHGITIRHKPKTGGKYKVQGDVPNDVVTNYVEHAFIAWLLMKFHGIKPPQMTDDVNCQADDVDAEVFFLEDVSVDDFLDGDFSDSDSEGNEARRRYMEAIAENDRRIAEAKRICNGCTFALDCLTNSIIANSEDGVWGGLGPDERHLMINRFEAMRRNYESMLRKPTEENQKKLPTEMVRDLEERAEQIAASIRESARQDRVKSQLAESGA